MAALSLSLVPAQERRGLQQAACTSTFSGDSEVEQCLAWCGNNLVSNCPRCKCRACSFCQPPPPPLVPPTPPPPTPPIACKPYNDLDFNFEACLDWCTEDVLTHHCKRCKCRACSACQLPRSPPAPPMPPLSPPTAPMPPLSPQTACTPFNQFDTAFEACYAWCAEDILTHHCDRCKCRACDACIVPRSPPAPPVPLTPPLPPLLPPPPALVACTPVNERDTSFEACYQWCRDDGFHHCDRCKCRACDVCRTPRSPPTPRTPPTPPASPAPTTAPSCAAATPAARCAASRMHTFQ